MVLNDSPTYVIGVVSDTHVPDRVANLHPGLIPGLRNAGVQLILHAGDVCDDIVIEQLQSIAPVIAVPGNRDFLLKGNRSQPSRIIQFRGLTIGLMHGHGGFWRYVYEKFEMLFQGYRYENYQRLALRFFPDADIIIYGHTHYPELHKVEGKLIMNPGSAGMGGWGHHPSFGLIRIDEHLSFSGKIQTLQGARRRGGKWEN